MVYVGNFLYLSSLQEKAVEQFKARIVELKKTGELFSGMCKIFMTRLSKAISPEINRRQGYLFLELHA